MKNQKYDLLLDGKILEINVTTDQIYEIVGNSNIDIENYTRTRNPYFGEGVKQWTFQYHENNSRETISHKPSYQKWFTAEWEKACGRA